MIDISRKYIFIGNNLEQLRKDAYGVRSIHFKRLFNEYRRLRTKELSELPPPESVTYVGIQVMNLSLLYLLTEDKTYLDEVKRWINAAVGWKDWGYNFLVNVDLSSAWLLWGLSLAYNWLKDDLSEDVLDALRKKILRQGRIMYDFKMKTIGEGWSTNFWQNHNWINMNGLATAGYALVEDAGRDTFAVEAAQDGQLWIDEAKRNYNIVFDVLADDGSDYEGTAYWRYGVLWLLAYAHLVREREGIDYFKTCSFLKNTFWYRLYQSTPNLEEIANFGDCHDTRSSHSIAMYYKFASEYKIGQAQYLAEKVRSFLYVEHYESGIRPGILPEAGLEYLWFDPSVKAESLDKIPRSRFFADLGLVSHYSSWSDDGIMFTVKCGFPGGKKQWILGHNYKKEKGWSVLGLSHQHADNNSIILHAHGAYLISDEGYSREVKASDHNVILVDGIGYDNEGQNNIWKETKIDRTAKLDYFYSDKDFIAYSGDTAHCYPESLQMKKNKRTILGGESGIWIVEDEVEAEIPHVYSWRLHSDEIFRKIEENKYKVVNGNAELNVIRVYPESTDIANITIDKTIVKAIMTPQEPEKYRISMRYVLEETSLQRKHEKFVYVIIAKSVNDSRKIEIKENVCENHFYIEIRSDKEVFKWYLKNKEDVIRCENVESDVEWLMIKDSKVRSYGGTYIKSDNKNIAFQGGFNVQ